ncbi:hypothetical protein [Spirosoma sp. KCTC 42546]|uniref:hypothetical protein n=1 Tax=Spirosoma sp. KCTC 42546 TaxID=2520506 RepID=UPI00143CDDD4|nr:hypothetical protein [Spirosoma sp. KCTC 42546]
MKGCFRLSAIDQDGVEHTFQAAAENDRPTDRWLERHRFLTAQGLTQVKPVS